MRREEAWRLLTEFIKTDSLRKHVHAVEAAMRAYAGQCRADSDTWAEGIAPAIGLYVALAYSLVLVAVARLPETRGCALTTVAAA